MGDAMGVEVGEALALVHWWALHWWGSFRVPERRPSRGCTLAPAKGGTNEDEGGSLVHSAERLVRGGWPSCLVLSSRNEAIESVDGS